MHFRFQCNCLFQSVTESRIARPKILLTGNLGPGYKVAFSNQFTLNCVLKYLGFYAYLHTEAKM